MRLTGDVIIQLEAPGRWSLYNVFTRDCVAVGADVLEILSDIQDRPADGLSGASAGKLFKVWDIWRFTNYDGLLADPTRKLRDAAQWPSPKELDLGSLVSLLRERCIIIEDEARYHARFEKKRSMLDNERFGNFHQQLGRELNLIRRENPYEWWLRQKFTDDFKGIRNNLYKAVQETYLRSYFKRKFAGGGAVVDVGCGTGFYARMMAESGASSVLGVDPNESFIKIARNGAPEKSRFELCGTIGQPDGMRDIPTASADFVHMSDAMLFYFVPETPTQKADPSALLSEIRRILKPGGVFISVEPHYLLWLAPWLGDAGHPFTVLTEYAHKTFGVTPNTSTLIQTFARSGFAVSWMDEMPPDPAFEAVDPRAYHFAQEFPLWQLYELRPI